MSQPPTYDRAYSFQSYQAVYPSLPLPADQIDLEYNRIKATFDAMLANLALIQRDDGNLANQSVGLDQLSAEVTVGFNVPSKWLTATSYTTSDTVFHDNIFYRCDVAHTSGTFATDLAAGKWEEIADFTSLVQAADLISYDNGSSGLAAEDVQDALDEIASEKLDKAGGTMSGALSMGSNRITNVANAAADGDAVSRVFGDGRYQPLDADLTSLAAVATQAYGRSLLATATEAAFKALVNLEAADILAALVTVDGSGSGVDADVVRGTTPGTTGLALLDDASAAAARTTLGLGGLAVLGTTDLVYTGSDAANIAYPIGSYVLPLCASIFARNESHAIRIYASDNNQFVDNTLAGTSLTGTWRSRGYASIAGDYQHLFQRTA